MLRNGHQSAVSAKDQTLSPSNNWFCRQSTESQVPQNASHHTSAEVFTCIEALIQRRRHSKGIAMTQKTTNIFRAFQSFQTKVHYKWLTKPFIEHYRHHSIAYRQLICWEKSFPNQNKFDFSSPGSDPFLQNFASNLFQLFPNFFICLIWSFTHKRGEGDQVVLTLEWLSLLR